MFGRKKQADEKPKKDAQVEAKKGPGGLTKEELAEKMEAGCLRVIVTFEVVGKPKEFIETSLEEYLANIRRDSRLTVLNEEVEEAIEQEEGELFSTLAEVEMLVDHLSVLVWIAVNFSPASIEVIEPAEHVMQAGELTSWLNDLLSKIHEVSMGYRDVQQKNIKLNESLNALIKNSLLVGLETGNHDAKELGKKVGIHPDQLAPFLENLQKIGKISKAGDTYALKK